ncbi:MAG TPA: RnfH family protein [Burkholderiaceae bacterium]|nr:RnfH family protein [Burkholderiaceae bacterium]
MASAEPAPAGAAVLRITVAYSPQAGEVDVCELRLPAGSCVADALHASGLAQRHPQLALDHVALGVWGALCDAQRVLRDHDRVEVYRPLQVDPKEARRRRQQQQREQATARRTAKRR